MLPIKLTLQAFGAYPNRVEIPFSRLGESNVYLITGVTGSGKTTIFDAICFALFNSSSTSLRGNSTLRSHFAPLETISFVEFEFLFNGEIYKITRSPSYYRKKTRGEGLTLENAKAQIQLPNSKLIIGTKEVDEFVEDLLGVNINQFSQIALLAQGEFLKLLNSDTQTRGEIFRNIFKTHNFLSFGLNLKDKAVKLKQDYELSSNSILKYISLINYKDNEINSLKEYFIKNNTIANFDAFLDKLSEENKADSKRIKELNESFKTQNNILLNKEKELVVVENKLNLISQKKALESKIALQEETFLNIKKEFDKIPKKEKELDEIKINLQKIKEDFALCEEIKASEEELLEIKKVLEVLINELKDFKYNKLCFEFYNYTKLLEGYEKKKEEFILLKEDFKKKSKEYENCYQAYLSDIAGFLASNLEKNSPCPVCGSLKHPRKAIVKDETITKEFVEKLKNSVENLREELNLKAENCAVLKLQTEQKLKEYISLKECYKIEIDEKNPVKITNITDKEEEFNKTIEEKRNKISSLETKIETLSMNLKNSNIDEISVKYKKLTAEFEDLTNYIASTRKIFEKERDSFFELKTNESLLVKQIEEFKEINEENFLKTQEDIKELNLKIANIDDELKKIGFKFDSNKKLIAQIKEEYLNYNALEKDYINYKALSDCANGTLKGKTRLAFEQYIQGYYLDIVLNYANKILKTITKNQFQLLRKKDTSSLQGKTGLDLEVMDFHTFKTRDTKTLSGGESFKAALALALGLSQCVSLSTGAININAMFIDEGFGSLDTESLELAMEVIVELSDSGRLVGVISHVEELKSKIQNQIITIKTPTGSRVELTF